MPTKKTIRFLKACARAVKPRTYAINFPDHDDVRERIKLIKESLSTQKDNPLLQHIIDLEKNILNINQKSVNTLKTLQDKITLLQANIEKKEFSKKQLEQRKEIQYNNFKSSFSAITQKIDSIIAEKELRERKLRALEEKIAQRIPKQSEQQPETNQLLVIKTKLADLENIYAMLKHSKQHKEETLLLIKKRIDILKEKLRRHEHAKQNLNKVNTHKTSIAKAKHQAKKKTTKKKVQKKKTRVQSSAKKKVSKKSTKRNAKSQPKKTKKKTKKNKLQSKTKHAEKIAEAAIKKAVEKISATTAKKAQELAQAKVKKSIKKAKINAKPKQKKKSSKKTTTAVIKKEIKKEIDKVHKKAKKNALEIKKIKQNVQQKGTVMTQVSKKSNFVKPKSSAQKETKSVKKSDKKTTINTKSTQNQKTTQIQISQPDSNSTLNISIKESKKKEN